MNEMLTGLVDTSDNMGELHMDSESFQLVFEIRSAKDSLKYFVYDKISRLAKLLGADCTTTLEYGSWQFRPQSKFRDKAIEVFKKTYGISIPRRSAWGSLPSEGFISIYAHF